MTARELLARVLAQRERDVAQLRQMCDEAVDAIALLEEATPRLRAYLERRCGSEERPA